MSTLTKVIFRHIISTFVFLFISQIALAEDKPNPVLPFKASAVAENGLTYSRSGDQIEVILDVSKVIASWSKLEVLSHQNLREIDPEKLKMTPLAYTLSADRVIRDHFLLYLYQENPELDMLYIKGYVLPQGGSKKELCYTLSIDKSSFTKIQTYKEIANITSYSDWCINKGKEEATAAKLTEKP